MALSRDRDDPRVDWAADLAAAGGVTMAGPHVVRFGLATQALLFLAVGIAILVVTLTTMGVELIRQRDASTHAVTARGIQVNTLNLEISMVDQESGLRGYSVTGQAQFLQPYSQGRDAVTGQLNQLRSQATGTIFAPPATEVVRTATDWMDWAEGRRTVLETGGPKADVTAELDGKELFDRYRTAQGHLTDLANAQVAGAIAIGRASRDRAQTALFIGGPLLFVTLLALALTLMLSTLRPLTRLAAAAERMAVGQDVRVPSTQRSDEVGTLARALERWRAAEAAERERVARERLAAGALRAVSAARDLPTALAELARVCGEVAEVHGASLELRSDDQRAFQEVATWHSPRASRPGGRSTMPADDRSWVAYQEGRAVVVDTPVPAESGESRGAGRATRTVVSVPLLVAGEVRAGISLWSPAPAARVTPAVPQVEVLVAATASSFNTLLLLRREQDLSERLRWLDQQKTEFLGLVAHDLRSPMTMIVGYATLLQRRWATLADERREGLLDTIISTTHRLAALVRDSLDVARIESGEIRYDMRPFDVAALVRRTAEELSTNFPGRSVVVDAPEALPLAYGDEDRWWQVLTNLLSNALKFSGDGTSVEAGVVHEDDRLHVTVADRGPGIEAEDMAKLFKRFSRIATPRAVPGTGLGLYICKAMAEAQGGDIWAESTPGVGSTFSCTLPVHREGS